MSTHRRFPYTAGDKDFQNTKDSTGYNRYTEDNNKGSEPKAPSQDAVVHSYIGKDDELRFPVGKISADPHGIAQVDEMLYILDYDSAIWPLGNEKLADAESTTLKLTNPPINLTNTLSTIDPPAPVKYKYHGNRIVALKNGKNRYLFALSINRKGDAVPEHDLSQLFRIKLGPNAVDMDITYDKDDNGNNIPFILLTGIGGKQQGGSTNTVRPSVQE
jgi:hypothetical protein